MSWDWGGAGQGAASGASAGAAFGPWGAAIGGIGGGLLGGFMGGHDDEKKADDLLKQIPDEMKKYLMPYINAGMGALPHLNELSNEYAKLYQDPNAIISHIGAGYRESPGYKWRLNQGENAIMNAQAAGGMTGTGQHQQLAGELAENLANQDYQNYLSQALGLYGTGLTGRTGIESGIFNTGANEAGDLAMSLANLMNERAGLSYQRGKNKNQQTSDMFSSFASMAPAMKDWFGS